MNTATATATTAPVLTVDDLNHLPNQTVIRTAVGSVFEKEERGWYTIGISQPETNTDYLTPAVVLYRP